MENAGKRHRFFIFGSFSNRGYTMIETIIVIVILGILAAYAVPKHMSVDREARISVVEGMSGTLRTASEMIHFQATSTGEIAEPTVVISEDGIGDVANEYYDINNDGKEDILLLRDASDEIEVRLGCLIDGKTSFSCDPPIMSSIHQVAAPGVNEGMVVADINGDGNPDVVIAESANQLVSVCLGNGEGHFETASSFSVETSAPYDLDLADTDSDDDWDVMLVYSSTNFSVMLNNSSDGVVDLELYQPSATASATRASGVTSSATTTNAPDTQGGNFSTLASGDLNSDGFVDAVLPDIDNDCVNVMLGDGMGGFGAPVSFPAGDGTLMAGLADVNVDGYLDILTGNSLSDDISVLMGDGTAQFDPPITSSTGGTGLMGMSLIDLNRDGCIDAIVASTNGADSSDIRLLSGNCSGVFGLEAVGVGGIAFASGDGPVSVDLGDIDGDGALDAVTANENSLDISVFMGTGRGSFAPATHILMTGIAGNSPRTAKLADLDLDGDLELLVLSQGGYLYMMDNEEGTLVPNTFKYLGYTAGLRSPLAVGDLDGDGFQDVVTIVNNDVTVVYGPGAGALRFYSTGDFNMRSLTLGYVNEDDYLDVVTTDYGHDTDDGNLSLLLNLGTGDRDNLFAAPNTFLADRHPIDVELEDVNGDGNLDLVTANSNEFNDGHYGASVLFGAGDGTFALDRHYEAGDFARKVLVGDANADGNLDFFVHGNSMSGFALLGQGTVFLGDGSGVFWVPAPLFPAAVTDMEIGDMNGNQDLDIVTVDYENDRINVWLSSLNLCPNDPDNDIDGDGVCGDVDNCPALANADQSDIDSDGAGDACDVCPNDADDDLDGDAICGDVDNCPDLNNVGQGDADSDGVGDACDICPNDADNDLDGDTICGDVDNCPDVANVAQLDIDGDGIADACDACPNDAGNDVDGDGICGDVDNCPDVANVYQEDFDNNGIGDACQSPNDKACFLEILMR